MNLIVILNNSKYKEVINVPFDVYPLTISPALFNVFFLLYI